MKSIITSLYFIIGISQVLTANIVNPAPLCCPIGWTLVKLKVGQFRQDKYDCLDSMQAKALRAEVQILGKTLPLAGYQIHLPSNFTSIPICKRPEFFVYSTKSKVELTPSSCLAHFVERIAVISCPLESDEKLHDLTFMHKCCPIDFIYDSKQRKCIQRSLSSSITQNVYAKFFEHAVAFIDEAMNCPKDKVLIEYRLKARNVNFKDSDLVLTGVDKIRSPNRFDQENYCIEAIVDELNSFEGKNNILQRKVSDSKVLVEELDGIESIRIGERVPMQEYFVRICTNSDICEQMACIRRCCTDGEMFTKGSATSYCKADESDIAFHDFQSLEISGNFTRPEVFGILRSLDCLKYRLDPVSFSDEAHTISLHDGSLFVIQTKKNYTNKQYCLEKISSALMPDQKLYTFLCFDKKVVGNDKIRFKLYPIGLLISCLFYAMTLIVYLCISKLRNLPGQILICLVCSLLAAYLSIALGQLMPTSNDDVCFASGFFVYFCLMAAFAWMNVMCFDIWQTFGSTRRRHTIQGNQNKRFLLYSAYGWGLPSTLTILTVSLTKSNVLSENLRPNFGHGRCWFTYDAAGSANLLFFSGPVGILFLVNLALFTLTLRYCNRVKREIFRMQSSNMEKPVLKRRFFVDKARFAMNTKLIIVMGITWLLELLSILFYDHKKTFFWAISDSFNVLLGVFVFFIFVFKERIWHSALERIGLQPKDSSRTLQNATLGTHSNYTKSVSMTRLNFVDGNSSLLSSGAVKQSPF